MLLLPLFNPHFLHSSLAYSSYDARVGLKRGNKKEEGQPSSVKQRANMTGPHSQEKSAWLPSPIIGRGVGGEGRFS